MVRPLSRRRRVAGSILFERKEYPVNVQAYLATVRQRLGNKTATAESCGLSDGSQARGVLLIDKACIVGLPDGFWVGHLGRSIVRLTNADLVNSGPMVAAGSKVGITAARWMVLV
ncbi:hypothetical protein AVDCRST_MAG82-1845 [uncultured Rubrobacteraceae bacterium]|uniref:Uncharacterized protein n=1 Tax=uncultured Rubrobacteraceae bacterium TaxID=349277 RepID=A0A6J4Q0I6_9ACTN|nr:hypothetical protein AVDCRST_MAG82-1845 [uncultured Rubrobacteraceae bacterium]